MSQTADFRQLAGFGAILAIVSCDAPPDADSAALKYDSAGFDVVIDTLPERLPGWRVDSVPSLRIGVAFGKDPYEFHDIRGATRLQDGRIAVLDGGSGQLRMYTPSGRLDWVAGGLGEGPGESIDPRFLQRLPGGLLQYQDGLSRLRYHENGTLASHERWNFDAVRLIGNFHVGETCRGLPNFVGDSVIVCWTQTAERSFNSPWSVEIGVATLPWNASQVDTLGVFFLFGGWQARLPDVSPHPVPLISPLGATGKVRYDRQRSAVLYGVSNRYSIAVHSLDGDRMIVGRASGVRERNDVERALARDWGPNAPSLRDAVERFRDKLPVDDDVSLAMDYYFDEAGFMWVKRAPHDEDNGGVDTVVAPNGVRYGPILRPSGLHDVFARSGQYVGTVQMPASMSIIEIGSNYVLGIETDSLGVQRVVMHDLSRSEARR